MIFIFFDVNGLIIKELKIDFLSLEMLALDDSHIAIYGSTSWTTKDRYFISILDINTGKYKIIYDSFKERNMFSANDYIISNKNIFHSPQMLKVNDKLVIVHLSDDILRIFDFYGNKISEKRLDWPQKILSVEQQIKKQRDRIASSKKTLAAIQSGPDNEYKKVNIDKGKATIRQLENGLEYIKEPVEIGWGTIAMTDSDGNILIFDEIEETGKNSFHVYNLEKGTTTSVNSFNCDGYDLAITKKRLVFHKGYVYGIQELSNYDGKPLRLVRFNVEAQ